MAPISLRTKRCSTAFFLVVWLRWIHSYGSFSSGEHSIAGVRPSPQIEGRSPQFREAARGGTGPVSRG